MAGAGNKNVALTVALGVVALIVVAVVFSPKPQPNPPAVALSDVFHQTPVTASNTKPADPVPSPAIITVPENGRESGFMVQVYSFQDHNRAEKALQNLKSAGYEAFMEVSDLGEKGTWYRVRIGGLANENQAKTILEEVRKNYQSGFIVKPNLP